MFEHVPQQPVPPPQPMPTPAMPANSIASTQGKPKPFSQPQPAPVPLADHATMELFKRTGLNGGQKILIISIAIAVVLGLIGVGIWLFIELDPFSAAKVGPTTNNTNNTNNANGDVPLQQLDSDKDGIRDIDERKYGTSATSADTDSDGLSDYAELNQYKTDPTKADTDGDAYNDKAELDNGYDPNGPGRLAE